MARQIVVNIMSLTQNPDRPILEISGFLSAVPGTVPGSDSPVMNGGEIHYIPSAKL
jgi:hypothetical protein